MRDYDLINEFLEYLQMSVHRVLSQTLFEFVNEREGRFNNKWIHE